MSISSITHELKVGQTIGISLSTLKKGKRPTQSGRELLILFLPCLNDHLAFNHGTMGHGYLVSSFRRNYSAVGI